VRRLAQCDLFWPPFLTPEWAVHGEFDELRNANVSNHWLACGWLRKPNFERTVGFVIPIGTT
jgi:hypothetical protein